ncbi:hypothetical protein H072_9002 [Dactylellina haptotyla CBS 200.50]|uniref:3-keto-steroid reductase n=1 Tax=Dactylellina haptotyla (strain CBS 200.50) TaxID=1284197 RepID=S8A3K9_DACHA|nr:hypothetical protein H072_9002 [Dactylellina haptotyla CBS 200.50]
MDAPTVVLITGANSGLGYAIACRVIVEFFSHVPPSAVEDTSDIRELVVCLTTRSTKKALAAISDLNTWLDSRLTDDTRSRVRLDHVTIDLASLLSVAAAAAELRDRYNRIHYVFCNAAVVPFVRIDWLQAARQFAAGFVDAMTAPKYKVQGVGWLTDTHQTLLPPLSSQEDSASTASELGAAFTANVFGHYYLLHEIMQQLHAPKVKSEPSRIIWIGSIESNPSSFNLEDIQGIRSTKPYESSKTLTDILVLGSHLPDTQEYFRSYTAVPADMISNSYTTATAPPIFLIAHPGIVSTTIVELPWWQSRAKVIGFWLCKLFGSPWHCIDPFIGANAPVWLAISPHIEMLKGRKWGSACDRKSGEFVLETKVDADVAAQSMLLWSQLEDLRLLWKSRLGSRP